MSLQRFFVASCIILCCLGEYHYNIADSECNGPFGTCTQHDKDTLGYKSIVKLHEKIDDDRDGQVELKETKDFMKEELQYKNDFERQQKLHGSDLLITVDELWKSWKLSQAHNWTIDDMCVWLSDHVKLPQYVESIKRNHIDGQFLPRIAVNDLNYIQNILQVRDMRHRNRLMLKATDVVLFGPPMQVSNGYVKDFIMASALCCATLACVYSLNKNRRSQEQIKKMMNEFERISSYTPSNSQEDTSNTSNDIPQVVSFKISQELKKLMLKTRDCERDLLDFKFKCIEREKNECSLALEKMFKQQSGLFGAFKIAHTTDLDDINTRLELMKAEIKKCNDEKREWRERWNQIGHLIAESERDLNQQQQETLIRQSLSTQSFPPLVDKQKSIDFDLPSRNLNDNIIKKTQSEHLLIKEINNNSKLGDDVDSLLLDDDNSTHIVDTDSTLNNSLSSSNKFRKTLNLVRIKKLFRKSISKNKSQ